jgi:hypothetical protein
VVSVPGEVNTFYVAYVHEGNTSRKDTAGQRWAPYPIEKVRQLVGEGTMRALGGQGDSHPMMSFDTRWEAGGSPVVTTCLGEA